MRANLRDQFLAWCRFSPPAIERAEPCRAETLDAYGTTPLIAAVKGHRNQDVREILARASDTTQDFAPDNKGNSPTMWALRVGNFKAFDMLTEQVDDNFCNNHGTFPLLAACIGTTPHPWWSAWSSGHGVVLQGWTWQRQAYSRAVLSLAERAGDAAEFDASPALEQALRFAILRNDEKLVVTLLHAHANNPQVCSRMQEDQETLLTWAVKNNRFAAASGMLAAGVVADADATELTKSLVAAIGKCALHPREGYALVEKLLGLSVPCTPAALQAAAELPDPRRSLWHRMRSMVNLPDATGYTGETRDGLRHGVETHSLYVDTGDTRGSRLVNYGRAWDKDAASEGQWSDECYTAWVNLENPALSISNHKPLIVRIASPGKNGTMTMGLDAQGVLVANGAYDFTFADGLRETGTYVAGHLEKKTLHMSDTASEDRWQEPGHTYTWHYASRHAAVTEMGTYQETSKMGDAPFVNGRRVFVQLGASVLYKSGAFIRFDTQGKTTTLGRYENGLETRGSRTYRGILSLEEQRWPPEDQLLDT